jgi:hypothetical protein
MAERDDSSYPVGYGKPPKGTRFKPGQSGNSKGRSKGARNFATVIQQELKSRIPVTENGKRKTISKRQAVAKQLVNKAAAGDPRAIPILLNEARLYESQIGAGPAENVLNTDEDLRVMESIRRRIRQSDPLPSQPESPSEPSMAIEVVEPPKSKTEGSK